MADEGGLTFSNIFDKNSLVLVCIYTYKLLVNIFKKCIYKYIIDYPSLFQTVLLNSKRNVEKILWNNFDTKADQSSGQKTRLRAFIHVIYV